jgi:hypothetical protein
MDEAADALTAATARIAELEQGHRDAIKDATMFMHEWKNAHERFIAATAPAERLEAALRGMENAFVLLSKAMQTSEIGIPLDVGLAIVEARDAARAALLAAPSKGGDDE